MGGEGIFQGPDTAPQFDRHVVEGGLDFKVQGIIGGSRVRLDLRQCQFGHRAGGPVKKGEVALFDQQLANMGQRGVTAA